MKNLTKNTSYFPTLFSGRDEFLTPFDKMFDEMFNSSFPDFGKDFGLEFFEKAAYPKCDIIDRPDMMVVELEIPGVYKEDISIEIKPMNGNKQLIISGKKSSETKDDAKYVRRELKRSSFQRSFVLHEELESDKISAEFKNGILQIGIPKKQPSETNEEVTKIEIK